MARKLRFSGETLLDWMKRHNLPINRQTYLEVAYGDPDVILTAEQEAELPYEFQTPEPEPELIPLHDERDEIDEIRAHALGVKL